MEYFILGIVVSHMSRHSFIQSNYFSILQLSGGGSVRCSDVRFRLACVCAYVSIAKGEKLYAYEFPNDT